MPGRRNRVALNPLLRKGGVHQQGKTAQRRNENAELNLLLDEWYESEIKDTPDQKRDSLTPDESD